MPDRGWTKDRPNILSNENLSLIGKAFDKGIVFGLQCFYYGGCSPDRIAFLSYDAFASYLSANSRAGDLFILWSLPELLDKQLQVFSGTFTNITAGDFFVPATNLDEIRDYLLEVKEGGYYCMNELSALYYSSQEKKIELKNINFFSVENWETDWQEFLEDVKTYSYPGGEIHLFKGSLFDVDDHILLQAKFPNEHGEVPIGGAY
jgi:hypothetical protein